MPFGYSRDIFKYPAVQYIPLDRYAERTGSLDHPSEYTRFYLYDQTNIDSLKRRLQSYGVEDDFSLNQDQLAIFVLNGKINLIQYRGYEVTMVGKKIPGTYQVFKITKEYFYKDRLLFMFYNGDNSEKINWISYDLNKLSSLSFIPPQHIKSYYNR